jgi:hypothetical protein
VRAALIAANTESSSSIIVNTTMRMPGDSPAIRRVASTPLLPGMLRSIKTTSGDSSRAPATRLLTGRRFTDELGVGFGRQQRTHADTEPQ